jgi:immune inhibitor A
LESVDQLGNATTGAIQEAANPTLGPHAPSDEIAAQGGDKGNDLQLGVATFLVIAIAITALILARPLWERPAVQVSAQPTASASPSMAGAGPAATVTPPAAGSAPVDAPRRGRILSPASLPRPTLAAAATLDAAAMQLAAEPPSRDIIDLAARMGRTDGLAPRVKPEPRGPYSLGDTDQFWVHDIVAEQYFQIEARLEALTDVAYFWVQDGHLFDRAGLDSGAVEFSERVVPLVRATFGSEWNPGVDSDPRIHVLHHQPIPGIAGYYSSSDQFVAAVEPYSNEREMFYINIGVHTPGSFDWLALLAHEFQHMVHWHADADEPVWSNEGLSELATLIAGYPAASANAFFNRPDTALLEWNVDPNSNVPDYAASFAFIAFLYGQYGDDGIRHIVAAPGNGPTGIEQGLMALGTPARFDDLFLDWVVANLVDDPTYENGRLSYRENAFGPVRAEALELGATRNTVPPYGTDYYDATSAVVGDTLTLDFAGDGSIGLLEPVTTNTSRIWWSSRGDSANPKLTRTFDLADVETAALEFRLFYELEPNWDYGYFLASRDGGATWERLTTARATDHDPNGNNYGSGITGSSGGWVDERLDLSAYVGAPVTIRFEVVTDDAVNLMGVGLDDLRLEALGFADDAETDAGWVADGWMRTSSIVAVRWAPQIVVHSSEGILAVVRPQVAPNGSARLVVEGVPGDANVAVAIAQMSRGTRHSAGYTLIPTQAP